MKLEDDNSILLTDLRYNHNSKMGGYALTLAHHIVIAVSNHRNVLPRYRATGRAGNRKWDGNGNGKQEFA